MFGVDRKTNFKLKTALKYATQYSKEEIVDLLLDRGADINLVRDMHTKIRVAEIQKKKSG